MRKTAILAPAAFVAALMAASLAAPTAAFAECAGHSTKTVELPTTGPSTADGTTLAEKPATGN